MTPPGDRFTPVFIRGWNAWSVEDHKWQRDNLVRDWRKKGDAKKRPIWRGTEEAAKSLAGLLNKAYRDDDKLITNVERSQSNYVPWARKGKVKNELPHRGKTSTRATMVSPFKRCECGAMYKGDKHCG